MQTRELLIIHHWSKAGITQRRIWGLCQIKSFWNGTTAIRWLLGFPSGFLWLSLSFTCTTKCRLLWFGRLWCSSPLCGVWLFEFCAFVLHAQMSTRQILNNVENCRVRKSEKLWPWSSIACLLVPEERRDQKCIVLAFLTQYLATLLSNWLIKLIL